MHIFWKIALYSASSLALTGALAGCHTFEYDPPPVAQLTFPEGGAHIAGDPLNITFDEPVDPATFRVAVWQTELNGEQEIPDDAEPIIESCSIPDGTCGDVTLEAIEEDGDTMGVNIAIDPMGIGRPGTPLILEILPGLQDLDGEEVGASKYYDIQFRDPNGRFNTVDVEFEDGVYIISAVVKDPVPAVLTLISDVRVLNDGRFYLAGGEGDEINGAPKETTNPANLIVDPTDQGWTAHIAGFVKVTEDGRRLLETDPIDIRLPITPLAAELRQTRLNAEIVKDDEGHDRIEGTLSFEQVVLINGVRETDLGAGAEATVGLWIDPSEAPEGYPKVCGDQCGVIGIQGTCNPPADFPEMGVCMELEAEAQQ